MGQLPLAPPATLSPTAVRAARAPGVVTASAVSQATGTTAPPAARVSHLSVIQQKQNTPSPFVEIFNADNAFPEEETALSAHVPTPTTTIVHMMSEKKMLWAVTLWLEALCAELDDITMQPKRIDTHSC